MRNLLRRGGAAAVLVGLTTAGLLATAGPASASTGETCSPTHVGSQATYKVCVYTDGQSVYSYAQVTGGSPFQPLNVYTNGAAYVVGGAQLGHTSGPSRVPGNAQYFLGGDSLACGSVVKAEFALSANYGPFGPTVTAETTVAC